MCGADLGALAQLGLSASGPKELRLFTIKMNADAADESTAVKAAAEAPTQARILMRASSTPTSSSASAGRQRPDHAPVQGEQGR